MSLGTDAAPLFDTYSYMESDGIAIDLAGTPRSRPFIGDWTGDGLLDALVGAYDGQVHLYEGIPEPTTALLVAAGAFALLRRRRR